MATHRATDAARQQLRTYFAGWAVGFLTGAALMLAAALTFGNAWPEPW